MECVGFLVRGTVHLFSFSSPWGSAPTSFSQAGMALRQRSEMGVARAAELQGLAGLLCWPPSWETKSSWARPAFPELAGTTGEKLCWPHGLYR